MARSRNTADTQTASGGPVSPFIAGKNKIINGDFGVWQRGTSFTPTNGSFTADRWKNYFDGSGSTRTYSRQAFTPGTAPVAGYESSYFIRLNQSVAGSGGTYNEFNYQVEDVRTLAGQTVTLSFWAKAAATTVLPALVLRQVFGSGGGQSTSVDTSVTTNISLSTSWVRYSYTITLPSISGKTIGPDVNSSYLQIIWNLPLNSAFTIDMWGVQLEAGSVATPFQTATGTIQGELAACQRYYYRLNGTAAENLVSTSGISWSTTRGQIVIQNPVQMRAIPTVLEYSGLNLSDFYAYNLAVSSVSFVAALTNTSYTVVDPTYTASATAGRSAWLRTTTSAGYLGVGAEL